MLILDNNKFQHSQFHDIDQTLSADEDHVLGLKAPEQFNFNGGESVLSTALSKYKNEL